MSQKDGKTRSPTKRWSSFTLPPVKVRRGKKSLATQTHLNKKREMKKRGWEDKQWDDE